MRQTTRSRAYSFRKAIFAPAPRRWALTRFSRSFPNWTVLGKKDRRSLEVAAAVPWFWRKDCQSLPTFVSFVHVSMGGMSRTHSAQLKIPRRRGQHRRRWNQRQSERFYQSSAESLEVTCTLRSFWEQKARRAILCFSVQNDQGKKVWDNRIWTRQVLSWFSIRDIALLAMSSLTKLKKNPWVWLEAMHFKVMTPWKLRRAHWEEKLAGSSASLWPSLGVKRGLKTLI